MYQVFAFYPYIGIKVRLTEYSKLEEMNQYIGGLRMCNTSYVAYNNYKKMIDLGIFDTTREQMVQLLSDFLKK